MQMTYPSLLKTENGITKAREHTCMTCVWEKWLRMEILAGQARSWPGGSGVRTFPEPFRVTFPNSVNPLSFLIGGEGRVMVRAVRVRARAAITGAPQVVWLVLRLPHQFEMWCGRDIISFSHTSSLMKRVKKNFALCAIVFNSNISFATAVLGCFRSVPMTLTTVSYLHVQCVMCSCTLPSVRRSTCQVISCLLYILQTINTNLLAHILLLS